MHVDACELGTSNIQSTLHEVGFDTRVAQWVPWGLGFNPYLPPWHMSMIVTFIDDNTRHTRPCLISKKSEVFSCYLKMKSIAERETGRKIVSKVGCNSTFPISSWVIYRRKEFSKDSLADTHQTRTVWPSGKADYRGSNTGNADIYKWRSVSAWVVLRKEAKPATLKGVR